MEETNPNPDQEGFGEASLGEAQSENPPADPEMLEDDESGEAEGGAETYGGDQDAEATQSDDEG
jgi:hypothetical protein